MRVAACDANTGRRGGLSANPQGILGARDWGFDFSSGSRAARRWPAMGLCSAPSPPPPPCPRRSSCFPPLLLLVGGFCLRHPAASPLPRALPFPCGRDTASASCAPPSSPTVPPPLALALALEATPRQTQPTTDCPRTGGIFSWNTSKMSSQSLWSSS